MTASIDPVRNAPLPTLLDILQDRQARKIDVVIPASKLSFKDGDLVLAGLDQIVEEDGVTDPNGRYQPTGTFDNHLADRLDVPQAYLRRLRHGKTDAKGKQTAQPRLDIYDLTANGLLGGRRRKVRAVGVLADGIPPEDTWDYEEGGAYYKELVGAVPADERSFLARLFRSDETGRGIARGLMSNRYLRMEDIDGLMAMLAGIQEAGIDPTTLRIYGDLTETRMYVHVQAPEIGVWAPELLDGYRSPFDSGTERDIRQRAGYSLEERVAIGARYRETGRTGDDHSGFYQPGQEPIIHSGFVLMNSELGNGRWMAMPELTVLRCTNGMQQTKEIFARTHLGSKLEDGHIAWSAETQSKELAWVASQTKDLVQLALSQTFVETRVAEMTQKASVTIGDPEKAVEVLGKKLNFDQTAQNGILRHFLMGGQYTAGGMMQAVTSFSQTLDADAAFDLDLKAMDTLEAAAVLR